MSDLQPTTRFTGRADAYAQHRPRYPAAALACLAGECGLTRASTVADIGAGTGILTAVLLERAGVVYAVEPNEEMRALADAALGGHPGYRSMPGRAEATGLPDASVDLITAAQAFHWFAPEPTRLEFARIAKPDAWIALIWNLRREMTTPFGRAYDETLRKWCDDYPRINQKQQDTQAVEAFFPSPMRTFHFDNVQRLDRDGLRGRTLSSSWAPPPGHPGHEPLMTALDALFEQHAHDGHVALEYDTVLYLGRADFREVSAR